jgi:UDP-N-acetylmuramoyl-tripeptide--D-alanyl-D-alanine ligase
VVVVVGEQAAGVAETAGRYGVADVVVTASRSDALDWVRENAGRGDVVLVKASRGAALEWIAEQLLEGGAER